MAVEDRLQEDVTATLIRLGAAGVKVWVLTGDKKETAVNISYSCGHFRRGMQVCDVAGMDASSVGPALRAAGDRQRAGGGGESYGLVVDGDTLSAVFAFPEDNLELFRSVADGCAAVVCCRMSPLQKAEVVRMMKNSPNK